LLSAFAFGDVFGHSHDVADIARLVAYRESAVMHPDHRSVRSHDAVRFVVIAFAGPRQILLPYALAAFVVNSVKPHVQAPVEIRRGAGREELAGGAEIAWRGGFWTHNPEDVGNGRDQFAEAFFALAQRVLGAFAVGHVQIDPAEADRAPGLVAAHAHEVQNPS